MEIIIEQDDGKICKNEIERYTPQARCILQQAYHAIF